MLSAFRTNSLSIALSFAALSGYGGWLSLPETTSIQSIYDRYIAREESRPRIFEEGIAIRLNREAPPVAALEEALRDQPWSSIERTPGMGVPATPLQPQAVLATQMAIRIIADNGRYSQPIHTPSATIPPSYSAPIITTPIAAPVVLPQNRLRAEAPVNRRGVSYVAGVAGMSASTAGQPRRLENLNPQSTVGDATPIVQPTKVISLSKLGLTRDQVFASLFVPMAKTTSPKVAAPSTAGTSYASGGRAVMKPQSLAANDTSVGDATTESVASRAMGMMAPAGRQIMIRGLIELSGGLALTHAKDRIAVLRESRGQFVESGAVWIREARYEIFVESMEGQLVAEMRSPQGEVIGRGQIALGSIITNATTKNLDGVTLRVLPVTTGIAGRVQSAYSTGSTSKGLQGARVEFLGTPSVAKTVSGGHFEEAKFAEGSRVMASLQARDYWPTLSFLTTGHEPAIPLFSKKMMQAFVSLTSKDEAAADLAMKTKGVIWGRVTRAGQTVANAEVDIITQDSGEPVYFNDLMIPESSLKKTGSNGIFAVPSVGTGLQALQVRIGKRTSDPVFVQTDVRTVASLELDVMKASDVEARAFDAFRPDWPLNVEVSPFGHVKARKMLVQGEAGSVVKLANLGQPSILDINGGADYVSTRIIQNPETRSLFMPMVQRTWFDRIVGSIRYNMPAGTGNVLGFIQGARFRVSMDADALTPNAKVIYFGSNGEVSTNPYGDAGGGFILLGVRDGLQTILIEADGSDRVFAATVLVQDGVVASLSHWLR